VIRRAAVAAIGLCFIVCAALAQTLTFPVLAGRVVDDAGVLDAAAREKIETALAALEAKTTDQFVVVTLKSLQGTSVEDYGYQLGRHWQIGQKDKNNGVLLIVVPSEHKVRIEVGYGLEGTLTDALSNVIIQNSILPKFKAGDIPGGIENGVNDIVLVLSGDEDTVARLRSVPDAGQAEGPAWPVLLLVLAGVVLLIFCATVSGVICQVLFQILYMLAFSGGGGGSSRGGGGGSSWSGGGGSFGGGGASGSW